LDNINSSSEIIAHWYTLIENFQTSSQQFYQATQIAVEKRQMPDAKLCRFLWNEGGLLSAKREYLRVIRRDFHFDICAAPFGTGFFVSWWLTSLPPGCLVTMMEGIPVLNIIAALLAPRFTHYKIDTALMFQSATHSAVLEVIDSITSSQGIKGLTESERKPIMREFYR
jgi:hypothetical protein